MSERLRELDDSGVDSDDDDDDDDDGDGDGDDTSEGEDLLGGAAVHTPSASGSSDSRPTADHGRTPEDYGEAAAWGEEGAGEEEEEEEEEGADESTVLPESGRTREERGVRPDATAPGSTDHPTTPTRPELQATEATATTTTTTSQNLRPRGAAAPPPAPDTGTTTARRELFGDRAATTKTTAAATTATTEAILDLHREEQDRLTESLVRMAGALKQSSRAFSTSLEGERAVLDAAGQGLARNETGLEAAARRMGAVRRAAEGRGWLGRAFLYAYIFGLMVLALLIVFVLPKLRF